MKKSEGNVGDAFLMLGFVFCHLNESSARVGTLLACLASVPNSLPDARCSKKLAVSRIENKRKLIVNSARRTENSMYVLSYIWAKCGNRTGRKRRNTLTPMNTTTKKSISLVAI